jgi:hypothetical protein
MVIVTEGTSNASDAIRRAVQRAFYGGQYSTDSSEAYFAAGEDLGVSVFGGGF